MSGQRFVEYILIMMQTISQGTRRNVVILTEIISPYRIAPFNHLAQNEDIDLEVMFFAESESRRRWRVPKEKIRFTYRVLNGLRVGSSYQGGPLFLNPGIIYRLFARDPDVIICGGWHHPTMWLATAYTRLIKPRLLLWSESTLLDHRSYPKIKEPFKRWMVAQADGFIVPGTSQLEYLLYLGAEEERIWVAPNAVDPDLFALETDVLRRNQEDLKKQMGLKGSVVLYVGRIRPEKGIPELLSAFRLISSNSQVTLVLVGDGTHEEQYRIECREKGLENIRFEGFRDQEMLPRYYAAADLFVFPTRSDPWGLVINEAMASRLPIICSSAAGAAGDLIDHGNNGFIYHPGDVGQLAHSLDIMIKDPSLRKRMGSRSREIIGSYTPERMAQGFADAILEKRNGACNGA